MALSDAAGETVQTYEYSVYGEVAVEDANHPAKLGTVPNGGSLSSISLPPLGPGASQGRIVLAFSPDCPRLIFSEAFGHQMSCNFQQQGIVDLRQLEDRLAGQSR